MATVHRDPNQVKWVGVRPGHNGEQVIAYATAVDVLGTVYTVPVDKILLLFGHSVGVYSTAAALGEMYIYDATPALEVTLVGRSVAANGSVNSDHSYDPPLELTAGYSLRILTVAATCRIRATIHGILIDA